MSLSLYRKWRPRRFSDCIGQEHIKTILTNALKKGKVSHAYLFSGSRGLGKTTFARILAKALNCEKSKDGEPCNRCVNCKVINDDKCLDIIEIDAASNRGVDEIRDLRDKVRFSPQMCQRKIYIIDEVHMLTKEAFNALLKTLEEPPAHAIFILATTEPHKLPATIISRCQHFDFRKPSIEELKILLRKVSKGEEIDIDEDALTLVARSAEGSFRDALSILEQVASSGFRKITAAKVGEILGLGLENEVYGFVKYFLKKDKIKLLEIVESLQEQGRDMIYFQSELIHVFRYALLVKAGQKERIFAGLTPEQQKIISVATEKYSMSELLNIMENFALASGQIKSAVLPSLPLETLIFKYLLDVENNPTENIEPETIKSQTIEKKTVSTEILKPTIVSSPLDQTAWQAILLKLQPHNHSLYGLMKSVAPQKFVDGKLDLAVKFKFHADTLTQSKNRDIIEKVIKEVTGKDCHISCQVNPALAELEMSEDQLLSQALEVFEGE